MLPMLIGAPTAVEAPPPIEVVRVAPSAYERRLNRARAAARRARSSPRRSAGAEKPKTAEAPEEKKKDPLPNGQVVEVPASDDKRPPDDARFLARENSRVERETVARRRDDSRSRVTNELQDASSRPRKRRRGTPVPGMSSPGEGGGQSGDGRKKSKGAEAPEATRESGRFELEVPRLDRRDGVDLDLDLPELADGRIQERDQRPEVPGNGERFRLDLGRGGSADTPGQGTKGKGDGQGGRSGLPSLEDLRPTLGTVARISGSPSDDYIENVPEGEGTYLNTRQFKYATYFYQVRDTVGQHWKSDVRREVRRRDPTGDIYGPGDLTTLLFIRLDRDGRLSEVRVAESSGYTFLDQVAIRAFEKAEVFPNPPRGIVDERGHINFHFGFTLSTSRRGPLDVFR